ncbi:MAG: hypothetical protein DWQ31_08085 [Planctomycetota bacterium]|nr:MAG: hypothetical protein DWQ31_08085 [Planctomycetota bacterium]
MARRACLTLILLLMSSSLWADDRIYLHGEGSPRKGDVESLSPTAVGLRGRPSIPVSEVRYIQFDDEPRELTSARRAALSGEYAGARSTLRKVKVDTITNPSIRADFAFHDALCFAKLAMATRTKRAERLNSAAVKLKSFVEGIGKDNYHLFEAQELLGDVVVALGKEKKEAKYFALARDQYQAVTNAAPWPAWQLRMNMKTAQAWQAEGKSNEAVNLFKQIAASTAEGPEVDSYKDRARLGMANAMAEGGQADAAIDMVHKVILATPKEEAEVLANAYLVLGRCARIGGNAKEEKMAYLRIQLLYPQIPEAHEEALGRLVQLWEAEDETKRAADTKSELSDRYPNSEWLKK